MALYGNPQLTGVERHFEPHDVIVSKTDLEGRLTYGNRTFFNLAGYSERECLGQQHNLVRHPEMPRSVFKLLWDTLQAGDEIFAYVVNRSMNGDHYWVFAHVTPSRNAAGEIVGYHSNRRVPDRQVLDNHIVPLYRELIGIEKAASSPRDGLAAAGERVATLLADANTGFNEMMFSIAA